MSVASLDMTRDETAVAAHVASRTNAPSPDVVGPAFVRLSGVGKSFATASGVVRALDDISFDIKPNEFFTLLGPSGCGKSTLLRLIAGFEHPDGGALLLDGRNVLADPPNKRPVNIVFQSYALFPHMSVARNVAFGLERQKRPRPEIDERVAAMLHLVELEAMAGRKPAQLSGGQQQRVALARALAPNPKLLLLDEPLSALDLRLRRGMQVELKRIQRESGIAFLLVTHDQEEALAMSDRIAVMNAGRIEQVGTPRAIHESPRSRFVAEFFGANVLPGPVAGCTAPFAAIRPEHIEVLDEGDGQPGQIMDATYLGATTALTIVLDNGASIKVENADAARWSPGCRVVCRFNRAALSPLYG